MLLRYLYFPRTTNRVCSVGCWIYRIFQRNVLWLFWHSLFAVQRAHRSVCNGQWNTAFSFEISEFLPLVWEEY
jgi:hypothetical protein